MYFPRPCRRACIAHRRMLAKPMQFRCHSDGIRACHFDMPFRRSTSPRSILVPCVFQDGTLVLHFAALDFPTAPFWNMLDFPALQNAPRASLSVTSSTLKKEPIWPSAARPCRLDATAATEQLRHLWPFSRMCSILEHAFAEAKQVAFWKKNLLGLWPLGEAQRYIFTRWRCLHWKVNVSFLHEGNRITS